jgi:hypothetical protein
VDGICGECWLIFSFALSTFNIVYRLITLAVEDITSNPFPDSHSKVDIESDPRYADASVFLVWRYQVGIVMSMMVVMAGMSSCLRFGSHGGRGNVSHAMSRG